MLLQLGFNRARRNRTVWSGHEKSVRQGIEQERVETMLLQLGFNRARRNRTVMWLGFQCRESSNENCDENDMCAHGMWCLSGVKHWKDRETEWYSRDGEVGEKMNPRKFGKGAYWQDNSRSGCRYHTVNNNGSKTQMAGKRKKLEPEQ